MDLKQSLCIKNQSWGFSKNREYLIVTAGTTIDLHRLDTLEKIHSMDIEIEETHIRCCTFMKGNSELVLVGYLNGVCDVINIIQRKVLQRLEGSETEIKAVDYDGYDRIAICNREGAVWIWKLDDVYSWEIEEIIEYSENDLKRVFFYKNSIVSCGYGGEVVIYTRWEDDQVGVKWEIDGIVKDESIIWNTVIIQHRTKEYLCLVNHLGFLSIYSTQKSRHLDWQLLLKKKVSNYPILCLEAIEIDDKILFVSVVNRRDILFVDVNGTSYLHKDILFPEDEPIKIEYSSVTHSLYILSTEYVNGVRGSKLREYVIDQNKVLVEEHLVELPEQ
ncbi:hypothetical protein NEOKW01_0836 [Nematocida sp. AWRm80]|nr:hypothetical protein NEOKW01_0836 [Nematocida sp. AWRm80]